MVPARTALASMKVQLWFGWTQNTSQVRKLGEQIATQLPICNQQVEELT